MQSRHEKLRKHQCHLCGRRFSRKEYLSTHLSQHVKAPDGILSATDGILRDGPDNGDMITEAARQSRVGGAPKRVRRPAKKAIITLPSVEPEEVGRTSCFYLSLPEDGGGGGGIMGPPDIHDNNPILGPPAVQYDVESSMAPPPGMHYGVDSGRGPPGVGVGVHYGVYRGWVGSGVPYTVPSSTPPGIHYGLDSSRNTGVHYGLDSSRVPPGAHPGTHPGAHPGAQYEIECRNAVAQMNAIQTMSSFTLLQQSNTRHQNF
jgi:hypothetical protein